jgi:hypothetical protein
MAVKDNPSKKNLTTKTPRIFVILICILSFVFMCPGISAFSASNKEMAQEKQLQRERKKIAKEDAKHTSEFISVKRKSSDDILAEARAQSAAGKYEEALASYNYAYDMTREPSLKKNILVEKQQVKRIIKQQEKEIKAAELKARKEAAAKKAKAAQR